MINFIVMNFIKYNNYYFNQKNILNNVREESEGYRQIIRSSRSYNKKEMTTTDNNNNNDFLLLPIYKVYPDLGVINPWQAVKTQEDEENYYKSLLYGCKECDRIEPSLQFMLYHRCTKNGKSKYKQHKQEALNRNIKKLNNNKNKQNES